MGYIGRQNINGRFQKLSDISGGFNGSATAFTLQSAGVNVVPNSEQNVLISISGVIQEPGTGKAYTASGTTLTLSAALTNGTDEMYCVFLGRARETVTVPDIQTGNIADDAVTKAKVNFISDSTAGVEVKGDGGSNDGYIQLNCRVNSHGIKLKSPPHSAGQSYTMVYPTTNITAGKFLKVDSVSGSGATGIGQLSFADAGGDFVKITSTTVSSAVASVSLTGMDSTYQTYKIIGNDITLASSDNYYFRFINSSGDITGSNYFGIMDGAYKPYNSSDANLRASNYNSNYGRINNFDPSTNATNGSSFEMIIPNPSNTATMPYCYGNVSWSGSNGTYMITASFAFQYTGAGAITGLKFYGNGSVNTSTGTFTLYGLK